MNSCVLVAKIIRAPQLRYTQENQSPYTEILVEFENLTSEPSPATLRAVAWGQKLAPEIAENYFEGDQVILEGRLSMQNYNRPEGFKEKRAELVISHIYRLEGQLGAVLSSSPPSSTSKTQGTPSQQDNVVPINTSRNKPVEPQVTAPARVSESYSQIEEDRPYSQPVSSTNDADLDDIPF